MRTLHKKELKMKPLIIGKGYLGKHLHNMFGWDITSKRRIDTDGYDTFIYTSWVTDVDSWEHERENNYNISVAPLVKILNECGKNSKIIFISSAFVFDGKKGYYTEKDETNPVNNYGISKLSGESFCRMLSNNCLILRIDDTFGKDRLYQYNYASKDRFSSPVYVKDLCKAIVFLIDNDAKGTFHVAGDIRLDRFSFSKLTNKKCNPCKLKELGLPAARPLDSSMTNKKIRDMGFRFTSLKKALKDVME